MEDENEKLINRYHSLFDEMTSYEQVHSCLLQMDSDPDIDDLRGIHQMNRTSRTVTAQ